ncbi:GNAT family acetyltransferase [Ligilactobacillus murinus]|uniref:GNAT family acetyltransferase n=1 Tax=Ligilactobacillus murinus TaxID=1622 RepID=UPI00296B247C|nr:GNAT family acetyltransferase [Ligilactobacillus murinus]WOY89988.1 GNAT family acetyltransferase [Ligilactobacillus murinus]
MALTVISLLDLLNSDNTEEEIKKLLFSFECKSLSHGASDVEAFLHLKAINFERMDMARTYLILANYKQRPYLAGYFAIANKPLVIPKKQFQKLSTSQKKKLMGFGYKTDLRNYECKGYLLGQLGKNYSELAKRANQINGNEILTLAYAKIKEAYAIVGGRVLYLECEDNEKIKAFYHDNGFRQLKDYVSTNNFCLFVKQISDL